MTSPARILSDRSGAVLLEIALVLPLVLLLVLGVADIGRFIVIVQKIERTSVSLADLVGREAALSSETQDGVFAAARHILTPFELGTNGTVLVSVLRGQGSGTARIEWQGQSGAVGTSALGVSGTTIPIPAGLAMAEHDALIVAEVVYRHRFLFLPDLVAGEPIRKVGYARPRAADFKAG
ncbi:TadE/TadG family type IV pilus assembly protein [Marinivivus vitaminiproducens]|uniref:TadE/TadG family type IV pilus assembly protein n=1 Tax=Marinivivus vitaminiproducens TaxID=3035935 RepID=UPI0027A721E6|nr:TadE/TadG family type IV pilus assembly protein [Geminicoccaceae bacterium SCSIO 64248]